MIVTEVTDSVFMVRQGPLAMGCTPQPFGTAVYKYPSGISCSSDGRPDCPHIQAVKKHCAASNM